MLLDRYRVVGLLGRGGMGEVYRADDLELGQSVALKFLPRGAADNPNRLMRFRKEVRIARQISHPNVCRVYDIGKVDDQHFLSMEFVDGEDLASEMRRLGRPAREKALEMARQLCAALDAAHKEGILHRDLKPANVMIDGRGRVRITDFGLAGFAEELETHHALSGTPEYMAPEQLVGGGITPRSDLYSLGLILFELFSGVRYRDEVSRLGSTREFRPEESDISLSSLVPDLDPAVEKVVSWCLAEDPANRPRSALSVAAALPGGDPLAAAVEAGETPSPEMVADAKLSIRLGTAAAWALLVSAIALTVIGIALSDRMGLARLAMPTRPPQVLAEIAATLVRDLGYPVLEHKTYGLSSEIPAAIEGKTLPSESSSISFWYRESPERLIPEFRFLRLGAYFPRVSASRSGVLPTNPPMTVPGMILVRLDPDGRLLEFQAVPAESLSRESSSQAPDYSLLFQAADIEAARLKGVVPTETPPHYADRLHAWEMQIDGSESIRLEATAVDGRPSSFRFPGTRKDAELGGSSENIARARSSLQIASLLFYAALFGSVALAVQNIRQGRADRRGATRLAALVFLLRMLVWLLTAGKTSVIAPGRVDLMLLPLGAALQMALRYWFFYLALEPYARRLWPQCLIGWTRLLFGRFRDSLVARDLLVGTVFGAAWFALSRLGTLIASGLGTAPDLATVGFWLNQILAPVADLFHASLSGLFVPLFAGATLMLLVVALRQKWLAATLTVAIFVTILALPTNHWVYWLTWTVISAASVYLLARIGLLALSVAYFVYFVLIRSPLTLDLSVWYLNASLTPLLVIAALAVYGFLVALEGRPLFRDSLMRSTT